MSVSMEDPNGRFEFIHPIGLDKYGEALGHFDKMLVALGVQHRTTNQFTDWLATRPDIAKYTPDPNVTDALSPHEALAWANDPDGSAAGIILSKREDGNVLLFGSTRNPAGEKNDALSIAAWGTKITKEQLQSWLELIEEGSNDNAKSNS